MKINLRTNWVWLLGVLLLLPGSGCASLTSREKEWRWPWSGDEPYPTPTHMAVMWSPDVLVQPGKTPTRGFGGRLYFYDERSKAVPVEGEIVVHGFDESVQTITDFQGPGVKRFRFTKEQLTSHYSQSDIGASYSIWVPWDAADGPVQKLTLVTTFRSTNGKMLQGEPAKLMLPGKGGPSPFTTMPATMMGPTSLPTGPLATRSGNGMRTTTIPLTSPLSQHLQRSNEIARITQPATAQQQPVVQTSATESLQTRQRPMARPLPGGS
jgi:hypothetical protein